MRAVAAEEEPASVSNSLNVPTGTLAEQNKAKDIVRSSTPYQRMAGQQTQSVDSTGNEYETNFNFNQALVNVEGTYARVIIQSLNPEKSVTAILIVDLDKEFVGNIRTIETTPISGGEEERVVIQENFGDTKQVILGQDYLIRGGRRMSYQEFFSDIEQIKREQRAGESYQLQTQSFCESAVTFLGTGAGGGVCTLGCAALGVTVIGGVTCGAVCALIALYDINRTISCVCYNNQQACP